MEKSSNQIVALTRPPDMDPAGAFADPPDTVLAAVQSAE